MTTLYYEIKRGAIIDLAIPPDTKQMPFVFEYSNLQFAPVIGGSTSSGEGLIPAGNTLPIINVGANFSWVRLKGNLFSTGAKFTLKLQYLAGINDVWLDIYGEPGPLTSVAARYNADVDICLRIDPPLTVAGRLILTAGGPVGDKANWLLRMF